MLYFSSFDLILYDFRALAITSQGFLVLNKVLEHELLPLHDLARVLHTLLIRVLGFLILDLEHIKVQSCMNFILKIET